MRICQEFKHEVIDYLEHTMSQEEHRKFEEHLNRCKHCQEEYIRVKKFYKLLDKDMIPMPEQAFFDRLKTSIRQREIRLRKFSVPRLIKVLVPAFAVTMLALYILRPEKTVEISIPTAVLLEDETIAEISIGGIVDNKLLNDLKIVEDYLPGDIDETIAELSDEEKSEFMRILDEELSKLQEDV
ncbi:zf-HC2 domain-containing protein [bacterium]|nr:zf-HC2 domain-containing protein [bacterium]